MDHKITKVANKTVQYYDKIFASNELKWKTKSIHTGSKKKKSKSKNKIQVNTENKENEPSIAQVDAKN